jgi:hypothetical protein
LAILSPVHVVSHTAAQILAAYGAVDIERGVWISLLPALLNNVANPEIAVSAKIASLEVFIITDYNSDINSNSYSNINPV